MVTGKPPRHSKPKTEPVTIDLEAKDVKAIETTDQVPLNGEKSTATNPTETSASAKTDSVVKDENPRPVWDQPPKAPIEPTPNVHQADENQETVDKPKVEAKSDASSSTTRSAASSAASATSAPKPSVPPTTSASTSGSGASGSTASSSQKPFASSAAKTSPPVSSPAAKPPATSGLVAAGIVGGIIALAAAGSMQYAGYLPPFSGGGVQRDAITSLTADIANLRQQVSSQPSGAATFDASGLEERISALETTSTGPAADNGSLAALEQKIASLEGSFATLQTERSAQDTATVELTRRLTDAETKLNEPRDDIEVARAIASAALKAAIDRGGPFLTELDTLSGVSAEDPAIAALRPFAATGVPSRAELMRDFPNAANAMLDAINQPDPNQGIFDRLTESALSLVKVRPVGNIEGESPDAVIARMENKLRNGDLQGASLEWDTLPEPAKSVSGAYKQSLDARIEVENLVNGTLSRAITSTGQQG